MSRILEARWGASGAVVGKRLYVYRGFLESHKGKKSGEVAHSTLVDVYDWSERKWFQQETKGSGPAAVRESAWVALGKKIYTFGGFTAEEKYSNELHELEVAGPEETLRWKELASVNPAEGPLRKCSCGLVAYDAGAGGGIELCAFGGYAILDDRPRAKDFILDTKYKDGRGRTNEIHVFNVETRRWRVPKTSGRAPPPCDSFSFVRVDAERVVLFGGWVPKDKHRSHSVYILNLKTWEWIVTDTNWFQRRFGTRKWSPEREYHTGFSLYNPDSQPQYPAFLVMCGINDKMAAQGDAWVFDIESKTWEEMIFSEPLGTRWFHTGGVIQVSSTSVSAVVDVITVGGVRESWKKYGRENNSWPCISGTQVATLEFLLNDRKIDGPIGWSGKKRRNLTDTTESAEKQFEDAMKKGKIKSKLMKMVLYGSAGSGKTSFKHLLIGDPPPQRRKSTPLAVRPISMHRVDMKSEKWKRLTPEEREQYLSRAIKSHSSHSTSLSPSTSSAVGSETDDVFTYGPTVDANLEGNEESITHPASSSTESAPNIEGSSDSSIDEHILHVISTDDKLVDQVDQLITPGFGSNSESLDLFKLFRMLQIVDSGGQPQFHDILPIFLTELSFYTFVFKLSDELESYPTVEYYDENGKRIGEPYTSHLTNEQLLQHCIQTMKSHWNSTSIKEEEHANILILGTHRDKKCKRETQEEKDIKIRDILLPQCEKEVIYPGSNSAHSTKKVIFAVNAKSPNKDDKEIAKDIRNCLDEKCTEEVLIPLNWYALEILLEELTILKKRGVLSFDECLLAASEKLKFDKESLKSALNFLHGLSVVFYYPDFLEAVVFVNPQVLLDKVTELVKAKYRTKKAFSNQWKDFYDKALVSVDFLSKNEFNEHYVDGLFTATELVVLFKNLFILADFIDDKLFMPALLSRVDVAKYHATTPESCVPPLVVKFSHGNLLPGVFCALICFLLNRSPAPWKLNTYPEDKVTPTCLHRNCVEFSICDDCPGTVTLIDSCKHLECYLSLNKEPEEEELDPHLLTHVRCCILDAVHTGLDKANEALHYSDSSCKYSIVLLCPCSNKSKVHTASASRGRWRCSINAKKHGRLTTDQKFWLDQEQGPSSETLSPRGDREASTSSVQHTEGTSALAQKYPVTDQQLDAMITDEHINNICLFLPRWEDIANQLKIDQLEIDDIKRTCGSTTITATNHRVLSKWKRENGSKAICRELVGVLDILLERDCAESVCEVICH